MHYIQREKKYLLKTAKQKRTAKEEASDSASETTLQKQLNTVNDEINKLTVAGGKVFPQNGRLKNGSGFSLEAGR
jgi:hypothetical protein